MLGFLFLCRLCSLLSFSSFSSCSSLCPFSLQSLRLLSCSASSLFLLSSTLFLSLRLPFSFALNRLESDELTFFNPPRLFHADHAVAHGNACICHRDKQLLEVFLSNLVLSNLLPSCIAFAFPPLTFSLFVFMRLHMALLWLSGRGRHVLLIFSFLPPPSALSFFALFTLLAFFALLALFALFSLAFALCLTTCILVLATLAAFLASLTPPGLTLVRVLQSPLVFRAVRCTPGGRTVLLWLCFLQLLGPLLRRFLQDPRRPLRVNPHGMVLLLVNSTVAV
mmetsp:Transcript_1123/g.3131  ORF Transcript_1123/g.3131 Transcript_1123/m.3131 type:complete len:280 (+) Transcript_1123:726-1565(+)